MLRPHARPVVRRRSFLQVQALEDRCTPALNVAVVGTGGASDDSGFAAIVNQLNNDSFFDFTATLVSAAQVDTGGELSAYDVVVIGNNGAPTGGDPFDNAAFTSALRAFVEAGGGVVMSGPGVYGAGPDNGPYIPDIDAIIPVVTNGNSIPVMAGTITPNGTVHPVTTGVTAFTLSNGDFIEIPAAGPDAGATVLATTNGSATVVAGNAGLGRGVFLGPLYSGSAVNYNNSELRTGLPDRLMEQAVEWASGGGGGGGGNQPPTDINLSATTIPENQPANTAIGNFSAVDPNTGDTHTFTLVAGAGSTDNASFNISGSTLRSSTPFNFEGQSSFSIRVRATDQGGLPFEEIFTITVTNLAETPTDILLSNNSVLENEPINTTVGTLSTVDPDTGGSFTYSLVSGSGSSGNAAFAIIGNSLRTNAVFDFETQASYSIRVRTTDQTSLFIEKIFTINVIDESDGGANTPPTLTGVPVSSNINEGQTLSFTASASDPDAGQTLTFSLDGAPAGATINAATGQFNWTPTEAQGPDTFVFNVQVSDGIDTVAKTTFAIVREVNVAPVLANVPASMALVRGDSFTFTATATDADLVVGLPNAKTFSLVGAPIGAFIDPDTGAFQWLVGETTLPGVYSFKVRVADDGIPAASDTETVTVTLAPVVLANGDLRIGATAGNDVITVNPTKDLSALVVTMNREQLGTFAQTAVTGRITVFGLSGNDKINISPKISKDADLYGGYGNDALTGGSGSDRMFGDAGNDKLTGGNGNDLLVGGEGKDALSGGNGLDVLLGGLGADNLSGGAGDDLLVAGPTDFDANLSALSDVFGEWTSGSSYFDRIGHLSGTSSGGQNGTTLLTATTVDNDGIKDVLNGGTGQDWFILSLLDVLKVTPDVETATSV